MSKNSKTDAARIKELEDELKKVKLNLDEVLEEKLEEEERLHEEEIREKEKELDAIDDVMGDLAEKLRTIKHKRRKKNKELKKVKRTFWTESMKFVGGLGVLTAGVVGGKMLVGAVSGGSGSTSGGTDAGI